MKMIELPTDPVVTGFMDFDELIARYNPAHVESSWDEWWNHSSHTSPEGGRVITALVEELLTDDSFEQPVILCEADSYTDEETGEVTYYPANIGNGMHRLKAHHVTGIKKVFVQYGYDSDTEEQPILQVTFRLVEEDADSLENVDSDDYLWDALSWRHWDGDNTAWLKVEFASSISGEHTVFLDGGTPEYISTSSVRKFLETKFAQRIFDVEVDWMTFDYDIDEETVIPDYEQVALGAKPVTRAAR